MKRLNEFLYIVMNNNEIEKLAIANGSCSDTDDSRKSAYSDVIDPYYLPTETELFKVSNKILGTNTIWDFALQWSWLDLDHESKEIKVFCPCGRSHKNC